MNKWYAGLIISGVVAAGVYFTYGSPEAPAVQSGQQTQDGGSVATVKKVTEAKASMPVGMPKKVQPAPAQQQSMAYVSGDSGSAGQDPSTMSDADFKQLIAKQKLMRAQQQGEKGMEAYKRNQALAQAREQRRAKVSAASNAYHDATKQWQAKMQEARASGDTQQLQALRQQRPKHPDLRKISASTEAG